MNRTDAKNPEVWAFTMSSHSLSLSHTHPQLHTLSHLQLECARLYWILRRSPSLLSLLSLSLTTDWMQSPSLSHPPTARPLFHFILQSFRRRAYEWQSGPSHPPRGMRYGGLIAFLRFPFLFYSMFFFPFLCSHTHTHEHTHTHTYTIAHHILIYSHCLRRQGEGTKVIMNLWYRNKRVEVNGKWNMYDETR